MTSIRKRDLRQPPEEGDAVPFGALLPRLRTLDFPFGRIGDSLYLRSLRDLRGCPRPNSAIVRCTLQVSSTARTAASIRAWFGMNAISSGLAKGTGE